MHSLYLAPLGPMVLPAAKAERVVKVYRVSTKRPKPARGTTENQIDGALFEANNYQREANEPKPKSVTRYP